MMGRWGVAWVVSLALGLMLTGVAFGQMQEQGQEQTWVGIDADTAGNTATALGPIDGCISVATGQTVTVDVFVTGVQRLAGWQGELTYDNSVVNIADADAELLLAANPASEVVNVSPDPLPDTDGAYNLVVADLGDRTGESGEGVLARLTLQAVGPGSTALTLSDVLLADPTAAPIGDTNGDTYFDGPVSGAEIRVDEACPSATPLARPTSAATPETPTAATATPSPAVATPPSATATPSPAVATPEATAPTTAGLPKENEGNGVPWALIGGIGGGAVLVVLLLGLAYRLFLRRAR
jgi:hypothetical protein